MKSFLMIAIGLHAGIATAKPVQISGTWTQQQVIESMETNIAGNWLLQHAEQTLSITAAPAPFSAVTVGNWLNQEVRHHPAGKMRKLAWSIDAQSPPHLVLGQNMALVGEVIPGWRWDKHLSLVNQQHRVKLSLGKSRTINGWCILISDVRPAKISKPNIADESEIRADWWLQPKPCK